MWFKNLRIYRLTKKLDLSVETLTDHLSKNRFRPCSKIDFSRYGWVPPLGRESSELVHAVGHYRLICARRQEKILPTAAVNELMEDKVAAFENKESRKIRRKEKIRFKEDIVHTLLPQALTRSSYTFAWFDIKNRHLVIDTPSSAKADEFTDCLRAGLGELPAIPLTCHGDPIEIMTRWVKNKIPNGFEFNDECELKNRNDVRNVVRCRQQDLDSAEIAAHLKAGKIVTQLALTWRQAIEFILCEDFSIRRLRFNDSIKEAQDELDAAAIFDQDFAVMTVQVTQLIKELLDEFGGAAKK